MSITGQNNGYSKYKQITGVSGETIALRFLLSLGYHFLGSRLRFGKIGEIDLVTLSTDGIIYCVEVRVLDQKSSFNTSMDRFPPKKILKLKKLVNLYTMLHMKQVTHLFAQGFGAGMLVEPLFYDSLSAVPILILVTGETQVFARDTNLFHPSKVELFNINGDLEYRFEIHKNV